MAAMQGRLLRFAKAIEWLYVYCKLLVTVNAGSWRGPVPDRCAHQAGTVPSPLNNIGGSVN